MFIIEVFNNKLNDETFNWFERIVGIFVWPIIIFFAIKNYLK